MVGLVLLGALLSGTACRARASREWRADDHDDEGFGSQVAPPLASTSGVASGAAVPDQGRALIEAAWNGKCATCHGRSGRGDGPNGPMVRAPDLTDDKLQSRVTDQEMATIIRAGRNRMPAFPDLPPTVVQGLIARIRALRGE